MNILAIESCLGECSVAVLKDSQIASYILEPQAHKQSEKLILMVEQALAESGIRYEQLDYIAVSVGPGSFTGIRIGIAAANGIALAIDKPIIGITCLEALAQDGEGRECVILDAGRNQVYAQKFIDGIEQGAPSLIVYDSLKEFTEGYKIIGNKYIAEISVPNAKQVALLALKYSHTTRNAVDKVRPLYIREPDAKISVVIK